MQTGSADRQADAVILTPRSCPSRPSLSSCWILRANLHDTIQYRDPKEARAVPVTSDPEHGPSPQLYWLPQALSTAHFTSLVFNVTAHTGYLRRLL